MNPQIPVKPISNNFISGGVVDLNQQITPPLEDNPASMIMDATTANSSVSDDELLKLKKINFKKKVSGKEKRVRQNRRLFRMLTPRNAIAALNELHSSSLNDFVVIPTPVNKFSAKMTINNVKYEGIGNSKMQAKNIACEKALRDLALSKYQNMKNQDSQSETGEDVVMEDEKEEVPMLQLASYALHKLFTEWESEGFEIPFLKPPPPASDPTNTNSTETKPSAPKPPKIKNELPPDNEQMHPVMLLSTMRPGTQYVDLGSEGITPNICHKVGTTVDNRQFIDQARSKKEARKRVATIALKELFKWQGTGY